MLLEIYFFQFHHSLHLIYFAFCSQSGPHSFNCCFFILFIYFIFLILSFTILIHFFQISVLILFITLFLSFSSFILFSILSLISFFQLFFVQDLVLIGYLLFFFKLRIFLFDYFCLLQGYPVLMTQFTNFNDLPSLSSIFFKILFRIWFFCLFLSFDIDL
jgi:hypothetical protein